MSRQLTFGDLEYSSRKRTSKREIFLDMMDKVIPWREWVDMISPYYFKGQRGRPPRGIEIMLRMLLLQSWYDLSDETVEESIYDSYAMRKFVGINFVEEQVPDATTLLKFRHLLEDHGLTEKIFAQVKEKLEEAHLIMHGGTIVDATIIKAPSSTKNAGGTRDPEMHQVKKGSEWYFGMKAHIGVDAGTGYIHSVTATPANVHDIVETHKLIRDDDEVLYGDAGYLGIEKREEIKQDQHKSQMEYRINKRPGKLRCAGNSSNIWQQWDKYIENRKSSVRSKVEHPFRIVKIIFGYSKTAYRGLKKNLARLQILFASANLYMCAKAGGFDRNLLHVQV
mgnify:CR=1 FL=1